MDPDYDEHMLKLGAHWLRRKGWGSLFLEYYGYNIITYVTFT